MGARASSLRGCFPASRKFALLRRGLMRDCRDGLVAGGGAVVDGGMGVVRRWGQGRRVAMTFDVRGDVSAGGGADFDGGGIPGKTDGNAPFGGAARGWGKPAATSSAVDQVGGGALPRADSSAREGSEISFRRLPDWTAIVRQPLGRPR